MAERLQSFFGNSHTQLRVIMGLMIYCQLIRGQEANLIPSKNSYQELPFTRNEQQMREVSDDQMADDGDADAMDRILYTQSNIDSMDDEKRIVVLRKLLPTLKFVPKKRHRDQKRHLLTSCSIEITNKISGICQLMGTFGNACVSGDYVDIFNESCQ